jgi:hypothetical protein
MWLTICGEYSGIVKRQQKVSDKNITILMPSAIFYALNIRQYRVRRQSVYRNIFDMTLSENSIQVVHKAMDST